MQDNNFNDISYHDAELKDIILDYGNKEVCIKLKLSSLEKNKYMNVKFLDFIYFNISNYATWSESYYINEGRIIEDSKVFYNLKKLSEDMKGYFHYNFLMNSGDNIDIVSKEFEFDNG